MKKILLTKIKKLIKNQYPEYSKDKIDEIMYGIEGFYLSFTKSIVIFAIAFILGIAKELLCILITFNTIRFFAFGMHASKSSICLIFSCTLFLTTAYICKFITLNNTAIYLLYIFILIMMILYAPADTEKRPLIRKEKRTKSKISSIIITLIFLILTLTIKNNSLTNYLIFGLLIESILINPITYKLFKMPYNNYKTYGLNTK